MIEKFILPEEVRAERLEFFRQRFSEEAVYRVPDGSPRLLGKGPGVRYSWQIYARRVLFDPECSETMATLALDMIARSIGSFDFQLGGLETAAVPVMCSIQAYARMKGVDLNVLAVRKTRKEYGLYNWIEGKPIPGKKVLLVDDLCNSSHSLSTSMRVLSYEYAVQPIPFTFTVVNKTMKGEANQDYDKNMPPNFKALYLLDLTDLNLRH